MDTEREVCFFPPKAIEVFVNQIPGNREMSLTQRPKYVGLYRKLGPVEDLPEAVQNIIEQIKSSGSAEEKAAIAHSFSNSYIRPERQSGNERLISFDELAKDPFGDCDDYSKFTASLLLHGGVNPRNVFMLGGIVKYEGSDYNIKGGHAFVVLKSEEGYHLLDNNLAGIPLIDPKNPTVNGIIADVNGGLPVTELHRLEKSMEILCVLVAENGRGVNFENEKYIEDLKKNPSSVHKESDSTMPASSNVSPSTMSNSPLSGEGGVSSF
ncbi:MAG: hypothetical protein GY797_25850 [Deltaproteobacteria bacterium]|nr:hypothetical protein [Deltaproteobacteria bacterium]